jgi:D-inositol-3-phosphate glycosyltransferase
VRVALIGPVSPRLGGATHGGVATHQEYLAAGLRTAGLDASLLATNTSSYQEDSPLVPRRLARGGLRALLRYASSLRRWPRSGGSRAEVLRHLLRYRQFLLDVRPDLVHVQHPLERCLYTRMVLRLEHWRIPLVVTAHSLFGEHEPDTIHSLMAPNLKAADRVIAVSPHVADQAVSLGVAPARVRAIRSGVDIERYQPRNRHAARRSLGISEEQPVVLFVGNLEPRKQVDVLLQAFATIRQWLPDSRLVVIGSGTSAGALDQTPRLRSMVSSLGLEDAVRFLGRVDDRTLLAYYATADVFALPSSSEAQGIAALEAMACGLTVIASAVGGLSGTIDDGRTGFLVPSGDVTLLAERLDKALTSPTLRTTIGAAAREAVVQNFSWPRTVAATIDVYRDLVGDGRLSPFRRQGEGVGA